MKILNSIREASRPATIRTWIQECNWHRFWVSFWGSFGFIGLGASLLVFGPTLLDFANHLDVGVGILALMFTCRAIGAVIGSVSSGVILDKCPGYSYTTISIILGFSIATTVILPLSVHVVMLGVFMLLNGVATGALDNGTQVVLLRLWGNKSGPCMQVVHFCFAFGAFIAPLIAKQFISEVADNALYDDFNSTCKTEDSLLNDTTLIASHISNVTNETKCLYSSCTTETVPSDDNEQGSKFALAYWISSSFLILPLMAFIYFAVKHELVVKCCHFKKSVDLLNSRSNENEGQSQSSQEGSHLAQSLKYKIAIFSLMFFFMLIYVGLEVAFGSLIFTVAVTGELCFMKSTAAVLQSVFWGTFAFTRLSSVTLALLKVRPSVMMTGNLSGSLLASIIMIFYPHNATAIWIGSAVLGTSYASIYPTTMTWMSENTKISGIATAVVVTGGMMGDISLPAVFGVLVAQVSPDSLIYGTFVGVVVSAVLVALLFLVACLHKQRDTVSGSSKKRTSASYERLKELGNGNNCKDGDDDDMIEQVTFPSTSKESVDDVTLNPISTSLETNTMS